MYFFVAGSDNKSGLAHNTRESAPKLLQDILNSSKFQELMKATSKHTEILEANELLAQDQYFEKLEKKEQLELKMMETYKVPCKAVQCRKVRL
jgi:minichromosome maintenance protein 10